MVQNNPENINWLNEIWALFLKSSTWLVAIFVGIMGKVSFEVLGGRKLNFFQWTAVIAISVFGGYLMSVYCDSHDMESQGRYLVPMATLFSEKIIVYLASNYQMIIDFFLHLTKKKKDESDNH